MNPELSKLFNRLVQEALEPEISEAEFYRLLEEFEHRMRVEWEKIHGQKNP